MVRTRWKALAMLAVATAAALALRARRGALPLWARASRPPPPARCTPGAVFEVVTDKGEYEVGEEVGVRLAARRTLARDEAARLLGPPAGAPPAPAALVLLRPDGSQVETPIALPREELPHPCDPLPGQLCPPGPDGLFHTLELALPAPHLNARGSYRLALRPDLAGSCELTVRSDRFNSLFAEHIEGWTLERKDMTRYGSGWAPLVATAPHAFYALYRGAPPAAGKELAVHLVFPVADEVADCESRLGADLMGRAARRQEPGGTVRYAVRNEAGNPAYFWRTTDRAAVCIEGFEQASDGAAERAVVAEYLRRYPSVPGDGR